MGAVTHVVDSASPGVARAALTLGAIVPDQTGQTLWDTAGVALATQGDLVAYAAFERISSPLSRRAVARATHWPRFSGASVWRARASGHAA